MRNDTARCLCLSVCLSVRLCPTTDARRQADDTESETAVELGQQKTVAVCHAGALSVFFVTGFWLWIQQCNYTVDHKKFQLFLPSFFHCCIQKLAAETARMKLTTLLQICCRTCKIVKCALVVHADWSMDASLTCLHIKTAEQRTIIQQYGDCYTGRWWVGCYIGTARRGLAGCGLAQSPPRLNVTAHPSRPVYVLTSYYSMWHCICPAVAL